MSPIVQLTCQTPGFPNNGQDSASEDTPKWLSDAVLKLERPETYSILWDAAFLRSIRSDDWEELMIQLHVKPRPYLREYQFDLSHFEGRDFDTVLNRIHSLLEQATLTSSTLSGNNAIQKIMFYGLTSRLGSALSSLPPSVIEVELHFVEEPVPYNPEEATQSERSRATRIENIIQQYMAPQEALTAVVIKYDENAEDILPVSSFALASLMRCEMLTSITMERCHIMADLENIASDLYEVSPEQAVFEALRDNTSLFLLRFRNGEFDTSIAESLARALELGNRSLQYLDFGNNEGVSDTVAGAVTKALLRNLVMQGLELNLNGIQDFGWSSLSNLTCMDISDNCLGDEGALQLAQLIPACRLERINLAENQIGPIGGCAFAWSLLHNSTITKINICCNPLFDPESGGGPTSEVTRRVFNSFKDTPAYKQGFLGMLCSSLRRNRTVDFINLSNCGIQDEHGPLLAILLRVSNLAAIMLQRNYIGDQACIYMCQTLSTYRTPLKAITLDMNPISSRGFIAFWKGVLMANDSIMSVQFGDQIYDINGVERGQSDLDDALRMNRAGFIRLRNDKNATQKQWVEGLIELRDHISCSYAFLQNNPSLCSSNES